MPCVPTVMLCVPRVMPCVPRVMLCVPRVALWAWTCRLALAPRLLSYFCEQVPLLPWFWTPPGPVWLKPFLNPAPPHSP